ncbi:MAG: glucose-1-phosphate adenylyltransferase subunit GlgD [Clostridia bacterium]|nr:glucose-1-phosphate adenylyltransferase subunit GlgD [Clostridia bacterium]
MANASGIIFSNLHNQNVPELTRTRTIASIPFGCRYRLVDFALSNMVNAGISNVSVITHYNYQSLMDHLGSGKDWDLARRTGGLRVLPPFVTAFSNPTNTLYDNRLQALMSIKGAIARMPGDYIVISDCNAICNIDLSEMIDRHIANGAKITYAVKKLSLAGNMSQDFNIIKSDPDGNIVDVLMHPSCYEGDTDISVNVAVITREYLDRILDEATSYGYTSLVKDVVRRKIGIEKMMVYRTDGYYQTILSLQDYFRCNMSLLDAKNRAELFKIKNRPVLTKVRNSAPTKYIDGCHVENSVIADGCIIEGTVENSVLFRGVVVEKGAVVRNSILFQDTVVKEGASINYVITDKNVTLKGGVELTSHPTMPLYVDKGKIIE